jgi:succinyl-diaminopimelate desuccinylase
LDAGVKLRGDALNVISVDEESGGTDGAGYLVKNGLVNGDMVIGEGGHNVIIVQECGYMHLEITTHGKTVHARAPWLGVNAIEKTARLVLELVKYQKELEARRSKIAGLRNTTLTIGTIRGGTRVSMVPSECTIEVDIRITPEVTNQEIRDEINKIIDSLETDDPDFNASFRELISIEGHGSSPDNPMIPAIQKACRQVAGFEPRVVGSQGGASDRRFFRQIGIPAVAWGVGQSPDNRPHAPDEYILLKDLITFTKANALAALELLGYEPL